MARTDFSFGSFLARLAAAVVLVGATFNPEGYSYYHWAVLELPEVSAEKAVAGLLLAIGWVIFLRATLDSLGIIGLALAAALLGAVVWMLVDWGWLSADTPRALIYIALALASLVLALGISWSFIRRRLSGQLDVDDVED